MIPKNPSIFNPQMPRDIARNAETLNGVSGASDIEGKATRAASE
jgi:hypothetical protein